jgi:hypothetical protein
VFFILKFSTVGEMWFTAVKTLNFNGMASTKAQSNLVPMAPTTISAPYTTANINSPKKF